MQIDYAKEPQPPPSFSTAKNRRQKVRACGMDPNYWYAVEFDDAIKPGEVKAVKFWKRSIAPCKRVLVVSRVRPAWWRRAAF